jgi:hypothetical protein
VSDSLRDRVMKAAELDVYCCDIEGVGHECEGLKRLRPLIEKLAECAEVLDNLRQYAVNIEKKYPEECVHGAGYSLLGQLAQQVSTDAHYALKELLDER